ncbi:MAG: hypothetical protein MRECE_30c025 [Mycoplasmataceae bacterium CE_OT135]|nr:MAG: hypothetical protein MRECE_30c025 [Mycoplasmataceae bacterium CE_OT135]
MWSPFLTKRKNFRLSWNSQLEKAQTKRKKMIRR